MDYLGFSIWARKVIRFASVLVMPNFLRNRVRAISMVEIRWPVISDISLEVIFSLNKCT